MNKNHLEVATAYYKAMGEKNMDGVKECLHPDVHFKGPLAEAIGREAVLKAAEGFTTIFKTLSIRTGMGTETQAIIIYDLDIPFLDKNFPSAALMSFQEGLISKIELFYDARPLVEKK